MESRYPASSQYVIAVSYTHLVDAYLTNRHIPFRDDASNATDVYTRNRIRHHVIPILKEINPAFCTAVSNMTALLREDETYLDLSLIHI